jgi:hypothetical protein
VVQESSISNSRWYRRGPFHVFMWLLSSVLAVVRRAMGKPGKTWHSQQHGQSSRYLNAMEELSNNRLHGACVQTNRVHRATRCRRAITAPFGTSFVNPLRPISDLGSNQRYEHHDIQFVNGIALRARIGCERSADTQRQAARLTRTVTVLLEATRDESRNT